MCLGQPGLTGRRFVEPRKLVLLILFGFEVDVLEIALKHQQDLVDKIFLVESTSTHRGVGSVKCRFSEFKFNYFQTTKPLMWERLKFTERFSFVDKKKVLHIIGDDKLRDDWKYYEWTAEYDQTQAGVQRVKDWSLHTGHLDDDDLFISASVGFKNHGI